MVLTDKLYIMNQANIISQRLSDLREVMRRESLAAVIFPSSDPHQSEYVADHWKCREWISGFDGSAGTGLTRATFWLPRSSFAALSTS